jgi:hypothetical protein
MNLVINIKEQIGTKEFYFQCKKLIGKSFHNIKTSIGVANFINSQLN